MRNTLLIAIASLLIPAYANAQQTSSDGLACFENLTAPEYPQAALRAQVDGSVYTTTKLSPAGTVDKVETQVVSAWADGPKLLPAAAEKAIRAAKVKPECAGKTVSVVFRYQLFGEAVPNPKVTSRTEAPNIIYIEGQPESAKENRSASKAPATSQR